jgi:uncharacterized protein (TIGR00255 family)
MTGYGSVLRGLSSNPGADTGDAQLMLEIRSVNGRFLDLSLRLPDEFRHLEGPLREAVSRGVKRGKVELRLNAQSKSEGASGALSAGLIARLQEWQLTVIAALPQARPLSVHEVLQLGRTLQSAPRWEDAAVLELAEQTVSELLAAREREGAKLVASLVSRIGQLRDLAARCEPLLPAVVQRQRERFLERWREALGQGGSIPVAAEERALSEAAAYALRIDVAEELTRLRAHLDEIEAQLTRGGELGKRLDFLIQELHREANTLGSKSAALELTGISVDMKVLIEQMREQVQNIE